MGFEPTFLLGSQSYVDVFHRAFQHGEPGRVPEGQARVSDKKLMRLFYVALPIELHPDTGATGLEPATYGLTCDVISSGIPTCATGSNLSDDRLSEDSNLLLGSSWPLQPAGGSYVAKGAWLPAM